MIPRPLIVGVLAVVALVVVAILYSSEASSKKAAASSPARATASRSVSPTAAAAVPSPSSAPASVPASSGQQAHPVSIVALVGGRPGAHPVPTKSLEPLAGGPVPMELPADFLDRIVDASGKSASFALPDGSSASGSVEMLQRDEKGIQFVQGTLSAPASGFYFFRRQTASGVAGAMSGVVRFDNQPNAYRVEPIGQNGSPALVARELNQVVCVGMPPQKNAANTAKAADPQQAPQTHPTNIPIPGYQNNIIPLQSRPGAQGVIYLDFDGEKGPFEGWGNFDAVPSNASNTDIKEVWQRVSEDYQPFNVNVTTDRKIYDNANPTSRIHVVVSPTNNAAPGAGGVAYISSFNWGGNTVCWAFYTTGKSSAEVIAHEVGHTLGLGHDGRNLANGETEGYYGGQGSGDTGWAPIMGVGYYQNLSQWSKGEYALANNTEDDLAIITNNNNTVDYRADDYGANLATAGNLEIQTNNTVSNEGILETREDVDAFRFTTSGGAVSLIVSPVAQGPDLDILAEVYNSSDVLVASSNPVDQINATISTTLPAGEYTLRISGVGKGNPLTDGYSDYATLGAYLVSGTVVGGVKPDRFTVQENASNGLSVGIVTKRKSHGSNALTYSIVSGNNGGAFSINPDTGLVSVADNTQLDYEALSLQWDDPATIEFVVNIVDTIDSSLNESVRVVVTVTNVNEAPALSGGSVTTFSHSRTGTLVFGLQGSDADRFDFVTYSIVSGNTGDVFAIDSASGEITVAKDIDVAGPTTYTLNVRATDKGTPALSTNAAVTVNVLPVPTGYVPGGVMQTFFDNINGETVANLTSASKFPNSPDSERFLTVFDADSHGDNYGSTIRGYIIPPVTGTYNFWIASDDSSELRISPNASAGGAVVRASVNGYTDIKQYDKFGSQASSGIVLTAGQAYYVEVRQKDGGGGDHATVAWQGPGMASKEIIPGRYLAPFLQNYAPTIPAQTMQIRKGAYTGATVGVLNVNDVNIFDNHEAFTILAGTGASFFGIDAATGRIYVKDSAALSATSLTSCTLSIRAADTGSPSRTGAGTITINITAADTLGVSNIVQQIWRDITGDTVGALTSDSRYPNKPTTSRTLTDFDTGEDYAEYYGSRIRCYVTVPTTGLYKFYLASDDGCQLKFSRTTPAAAITIASVTGYTARNVWNAQASQTSTQQALIAGTKYYLEIVHKQGFGGDFVQVGWTGPNISAITVIPASALTPFDINAAPTWTGAPYSFTVQAGAANGFSIGQAVATDPEGEALTYAILSGNSSGAFAIDSATGAITVANSAALPAGQVVTLTVGAQDLGLGSVYPQKAATTTATITVPGSLDQWRQSRFGANAGNAAIAGNDADPDRDGIPNQMEYALGTDPAEPSPSSLVFDTTTVSGQTYLRVSASKGAAATEAVMTVQTSGSTETGWNTATTVIELNNATTLRVRDSIPIGTANSRYIRLWVGP